MNGSQKGKKMKINGITIGDPAGIGPEITLKALKKANEYKAKYVVYGSLKVLQYYNDLLSLGFRFIEIHDPLEYQEGYLNVLNIKDLSPEDFTLGKVAPVCGDAAYQYLVRAIQDAMDRKIGAIVTAPLNKEALHLGGHFYDGHTEILAKKTGTKKFAMMFMGPFKIIHVSTHCSLREACDRVKKERVLDCIRFAEMMMKKTGIDHPSIAVAGLNPHAGEHGLFGNEEIEEIIPAVEEARKEGINALGPISPDSVFIKNLDGIYDAVVAMYHDQGHIAAKLGNVNQCVNCTVGLPIIRTSVDHGTGFDIAGKGIASEENMMEAIKAAELFEAREG